jgi:hypothetical protein
MFRNLLLSLFCLFCASLGAAPIVHVEFTGTVITVLGEMAPWAEDGDKVFGSFYFDTAAPNTFLQSGFPHWGTYAFEPDEAGLEVWINGVQIQSRPIVAGHINGGPWFTLISWVDPATLPPDLELVNPYNVILKVNFSDGAWDFGDAPPYLFGNNGDLPSGEILTDPRICCDGDYGSLGVGDSQITWRLDSVAVADPVPEPSTQAMIGLALGILGFVLRRRRTAR